MFIRIHSLLQWLPTLGQVFLLYSACTAKFHLTHLLVGNTDFSPSPLLSSTGSGWKFPFLTLAVFPFGNFFQIFLKNPLTTCPTSARITPVAASVAHLVERHLAKVEVASSSLVTRSKKKGLPIGSPFFLGFSRQRRLSPFGLKCSAEVNSACAEVLPAAKRSYGAKAPPARRPVGWFPLYLFDISKHRF